MGSISNAFRAAGLIYRSLPPGVLPEAVGIVSHGDSVDLAVPADGIAAMEMGLALQPALDAGILTMGYDDGIAIVTVKHVALDSEGW